MNSVMHESTTRSNMEAYFKTHDVKYIAEDAVFIDMSSGDRHQGREDIAKMLHYIYHIAFDAKASVDNYIITEDRAMIEGLFVGKHIGNFAGIEATNKSVNVPLCVSYTLEKGLIKEARIYMLANVLIEQLHK